MFIVGTSGFFYYDWKGSFYPESLPPSKWLDYYASNFNGLEVNSTFYRLPSPSGVKRYCKYIESLTFVFKLYKGITHYRKVTSEYLEPFIKVKEMLGDALYGFLAQFPSTFRPLKENRNFLIKLKKGFEGIEVVLELRAIEWKDYLDWLSENRFVVAKIDFPPSKRWFSGGVFSEDTAYFRFHGKRKLYSDLYTEDELIKIKEEVLSVSSRHTFIFFNNTSKGKGALNALTLKKLLFTQGSNHEN